MQISKRHRKETRLGWKLVRGGLSDWGHDKEFARAEFLSEKVDEFGLPALRFHDFAVSEASNGSDIPEERAVFLVHIYRQVQLLDAVRATTLLGRPMAAYSIIRSMYEGFLTSVLFTMPQCNISAKFTKTTKRETYTSKQLARRFYASAQYDIGRMIENYCKLHPNQNAEFKEVLDLYHSLPKPNLAGHWSPFRNGRALFDFLWPEEHTPLFDPKIAGLTWQSWQALRSICYSERNHEVHVTPLSFFRNEYKHGWERNWDSLPLQLALDMAEMTLSACAAGYGLASAYHGLRNTNPNQIRITRPNSPR